MTPLILELLGPPRLSAQGGNSVQLSGIPLAVLAYLTLEGRAIGRDHLATLFWPGMDRSRQLHNLRQTLLRIRGCGEVDPIDGDNGTLGIRPGVLTTDVAAFLVSVAEGRVGEGVALWRGPFLQGFRRPESWELEDWVDRKRAMLEETLANAVVSEARRALVAGSPGVARSLLVIPRKALPYQEELGALEVMALAGMGRIPEAEGLLKSLDLEGDIDLKEEALEAIASAPDPLLSAIPDVPIPEVPVPETQPPETQPPGAQLPGAQLPGAQPPGAQPPGAQLPEALEPILRVESLGPEPASRATPFRLRISGGRRWLPWLAAASVIGLFSLGLVQRHSVDAAILANGRAGYALLVSAGWATDGTSPQLYRMGFDGSNKHRLSERRIAGGAWVEEGEVIFGSMLDSEGVLRLFALSPNPKNPIAEWDVHQVESAAHLKKLYFSQGAPTVGAGGTLVFSAEDEEGNRDIYSLKGATEELRRLTSDGSIDYWPTVTPGGERVIFTSLRSGGGDLYSIGLDGTGLTRLTNDTLHDGASWIRGDSVIFVRGRGVEEEDGNMELLLLDLTTGSEVQLTENHWNDYEQEWSPDGRFLCWQSEELGHYEADIMVMDLRSGDIRNLTNHPGRESDCRWTPEGNGVLYLGWRGGEYSEIYLQSLSGGDPLDLTRYPADEAVVDVFRLPEGLR